MKTKGKIYISGKVAEESEKNLVEKFNKAEAMLKTHGFEVVNPLELIKKFPATIRWQVGASKCVEALKNCTAIYMLPCSTGCEVSQMELQKAMELNLFIYYELENVEEDEPINDLHSEK